MAEVTSLRVVRVRGHVQGVGFRWWTRSELARRGLTGGATNLADGSVEVVIRGDPAAVAGFLSVLRGPQVPGRVDSVQIDPPVTSP